MGFLSSADVVESSATDFVGQYIGQTGPKTQKLLEKALGKVLFIDEAYRLAEGHFAKEAVDELVDVLTKPKFLGKIVVILAGYDNDMNRLLAVNPGLGSRFPEEIYFHNMPPKNCLELLEDDLKKKKIASEALKDRDSPAYSEILELVTKLSGLPSWGNARDVKTLAKTMVGMVYKAKSTEKTGLVISANDTISCIKTFIAEREARENTSSSSSSTAIPDITKTLRTLPPPGAPPPPNIATEQAAPKQKQTSARPAPARPTPARPTPARPTPARPTSASDSVRDQGVTDEVWAQLCADKAAEEARVKRVQKEVEQRKKDIAKLEARDAEQRALAEKLELQIARDDAEELERRRKLEEARLAEARAKMARDKALAEFERRRAQERRKIQEEVKAQRKLKEMGVCSAGYRWIKQTDGYRCAGGFHFVSKSQLGI